MKRSFISLVMVFFSLWPSIQSASSSNDKVQLAAASIIGGAALLSATHAYGWVKWYLYHQELYHRKHTWNFLEELFPSHFEFVQAEGEAVAKIFDNIRRYKPLVATDPFICITFIKDAETDMQLLAAMRHELEGDKDSFFHSLYRKSLNKTLYYGLQKKYVSLVQEIDRYQKRLAHIMRIITSSYEFTLQLAHRTHAIAHINYSVPQK